MTLMDVLAWAVIAIVVAVVFRFVAYRFLDWYMNNVIVPREFMKIAKEHGIEPPEDKKALTENQMDEKIEELLKQNKR